MDSQFLDLLEHVRRNCETGQSSSKHNIRDYCTSVKLKYFVRHGFVDLERSFDEGRIPPILANAHIAPYLSELLGDDSGGFEALTTDTGQSLNLIKKGLDLSPHFELG